MYHGKNNDLPQVTDKLYRVKLYPVHWQAGIKLEPLMMIVIWLPIYDISDHHHLEKISYIECTFDWKSPSLLNACCLYLFKYTSVTHDFHIRWCACHLTVTRRVSHVEQEPLTLPEHLSTPPVLAGSCCSIFSFLCNVL